MRVRVLYFGVLREHFGTSEAAVELQEEQCTVRGLLSFLQSETSQAAGRLGGRDSLDGLWTRLAVAVNQQYADPQQSLHPDDEVALLPPVSGGSPERVLLTTDRVQAEPVLAAIKAGSDGAVVLFDGIVRDNTRGRQTQYLVYEAYEAMALAEMRKLAAEAQRCFPVREVWLHHRLGRLAIGETSVLIAVASAHRGAAFDACRWVIDTLKTTVPIWKKEFFVDGAVWADGEPFPESVTVGAIAPTGAIR